MSVSVSVRSRGADLLRLGALAALIALAFGAALNFGFLNYDDPAVVVDNEVIEGLTASHFRAVFSEVRDHAYLPLYYASFWIDHAI
ncbi:MAG: hypothetical protein KDB53_10450, partial [Planctomycetes bacterium]|nr:hypothetical protein [Planctomycetota bacterium]